MDAAMKSNSFRGDFGVAATRLAVGALGLVLFLGLPGRARGQHSSFAGWLLDVKCDAQFKESQTSTPPEVNLKPGQRRPLVAGESVHCQSGKSLTILVVDGAQTVYPSKWVDIKPSGSAVDSKSMVRMFSPAFTRGAGPSQTIFVSPPSEGTVDPEHVIVRWKPPAGEGEVTFAVRPENSERLLCCEGTYPGSSGSLDSAELRAALTKYRDRGAREPLELLMHDASGHEYRVSFTVLTPPDAKKLQLELEEWDGKDELVRYLGRASVFDGFDLFTEAAADYETALKEAPNSPVLLRSTEEAERRTGNSARANELEGKLAQVMAKAQ